MMHDSGAFPLRGGTCRIAHLGMSVRRIGTRCAMVGIMRNTLRVPSNVPHPRPGAYRPKGARSSLGALTAIALLVVLPGCGASQKDASAPDGPAAASAATTTSSTPATAPRTDSNNAENPGNGLANEVCDLVCEQVKLERGDSEDIDYHLAAVENANKVIHDLHDEMVACYRDRVKASPKAHGSLTAEIFIGPKGNVEKVETSGGALLGKEAMACIVKHIKGAQFMPVHGGGTRRIHVPFELRMVPRDEI